MEIMIMKHPWNRRKLENKIKKNTKTENTKKHKTNKTTQSPKVEYKKIDDKIKKTIKQQNHIKNNIISKSNKNNETTRKSKQTIKIQNTKQFNLNNIYEENRYCAG